MTKETSAYVAVLGLLLFLVFTLGFNLGHTAAIQEEVKDLNRVYHILTDHMLNQAK